MRGEIMVRD